MLSELQHEIGWSRASSEIKMIKNIIDLPFFVVNREKERSCSTLPRDKSKKKRKIRYRYNQYNLDPHLQR